MPVKIEDSITIQIHGSEEERQQVTNWICQYMAGLAEKCQNAFGKTGWGWTLESTREPDDF